MPLHEDILERYLTHQSPLSVPLDLHDLEKDLHDTPTLQKYSITHAWCYRSRLHEFLIFRLIGPGIENQSTNRVIWMRMERAPKVRRLASISSSGRIPAKDTYSIHYKLAALMEGESKKRRPMAALDRLSGLSIRHVVSLMSIIRDVSGKWELLGTNCRWFCAVTLDALGSHFSGSWAMGVSKGGLWNFRGEESQSAKRVRELFNPDMKIVNKIAHPELSLSKGRGDQGSCTGSLRANLKAKWDVDWCEACAYNLDKGFNSEEQLGQPDERVESPEANPEVDFNFKHVRYPIKTPNRDGQQPYQQTTHRLASSGVDTACDLVMYPVATPNEEIQQSCHPDPTIYSGTSSETESDMDGISLYSAHAVSLNVSQRQSIFEDATDSQESLGAVSGLDTKKTATSYSHSGYLPNLKALQPLPSQSCRSPHRTMEAQVSEQGIQISTIERYNVENEFNDPSAFQSLVPEPAHLMPRAKCTTEKQARLLDLLRG